VDAGTSSLANQLLQLALRQFNDAALILLDAAGQVVSWSKGAEQIFGYTSGEAVGQTLHCVFVPEDIERGIPEHELEVARANGRAEDDRWLLRRDGARIWVSGSVVALRDEASQVVGFAKLTRNRTEWRAQLDAAENELGSVKEFLERHTTTLGKVAHELRNPLSAICSAAQLLQLAPRDSETVLQAAGLIDRQAKMMANLVEQLTDVTRMEAGKVRLRLETIELGRLTQAAAETCRPLISERGHEIQLLLPSEPIRFVGDFARLEQVLVNLIQNSAKYTPPGGRIWVKGTIEEQEAVIRVEDTGLGISPALQPHIFELFTQAETALENPRGGLGIGLCLVKEFVTLHGGTVQVRSDGEGRGSEFTVRLPLKGPDSK
jgi:PAS domain S-box-containing protein